MPMRQPGQRGGGLAGMHMGGPGVDARSEAQAKKEAYRLELEAQVNFKGLRWGGTACMCACVLACHRGGFPSTPLSDTPCLLGYAACQIRAKKEAERRQKEASLEEGRRAMGIADAMGGGPRGGGGGAPFRDPSGVLGAGIRHDCRSFQAMHPVLCKQGMNFICHLRVVLTVYVFTLLAGHIVADLNAIHRMNQQRDQYDMGGPMYGG
eukprot:scaffold17146_cov19-Tisochrysis_lutea.AAC.3